MALYPTLEDMKVDQMMKAQAAHEAQHASTVNSVANAPYYSYQVPPVSAPVAASAPSAPILYPNLDDYMGIQLTPEFVAEHMPNVAESQPPPYAESFSPSNSAVAIPQPNQVALPQTRAGLIAPLSGVSAGLHRAEVTHGIREVVLCKDAKGKVGLRVKDVNKGIFVALVQKDSPAAVAHLRFGDQILQINGTNMAGYSPNKVHDLFKKAANNNIVLAVRDRPFERTITLHRDSVGNVGFGFKNGKIINIVKDSSAARNGILIDHQLLEIDGQNVVGLKDKDISKIIDGADKMVTLTIMPSFLYDHMIKNMRGSVVKEKMDHSIPDL